MNKTVCVLIFISIFLFNCCKKKEINTKTVVETLESGTWSVSYYTVANIDKVSDLDKYILTFNANDTVTATNLGTTTKGTWNYNGDENVLHLSFTNATLLNEISKGWLVILKTDSEFIFDEDSSANDEELHINKN